MAHFSKHSFGVGVHAVVAMLLVTSSCGGSSDTSTTVSSVFVTPSVSSTTVNGHQTFTRQRVESGR